MDLILVESPIKVKTITKYLQELGKRDFRVFATAGHIIDLDTNSYSITREANGNFIGHTKPIKGKEKIISDLKKLVKSSTNIFMCQDDDREGERISQDIVDICKIKRYYRITFTEISKKSIKKSLVDKENIRHINDKVVLAQYTRRMVDRIIGYGLSPILSYYFEKNKVLTFMKDGKEQFIKPKGTGRVIGISLGILAKRQKEIEEYTETSTNIVVARYYVNGTAFDAMGDKLEFTTNNSQGLNSAIAKAKNYQHIVYDYKPSIQNIPPYPAFATHSLYSGCSYNYGLLPMETKKIAQELFETGYIVYPRTDNYELSEEASSAIIEYLFNALPEKDHCNILTKKRTYKKKSAFAQEAHEAIRPIYIEKKYEPKNILKIWENDTNCKGFTNFHKFVYSLIWYRAISTQLIDSIYDNSKIIIKAGDYTFSAKARDRTVDGWEKYFGDILHASDKGDDKEVHDNRIVIPNSLTIGAELEEFDIYDRERKSRKPKRISEGGLVAILSNNGIARPSTLHTVSNALKNKGYATSTKTLLVPTELCMAVYNVTQQHLEWINNVKDAQDFEKVIEAIESGKILDVNAVIQIYWDKVEEFKNSIGYVEYSDREPSSKQVDYAKVLYNKMDDEKKREVNFDEVVRSKSNTSRFIEMCLKG